MSFAEIEAELETLHPNELRRLAIKSWAAFVQKERATSGANECDEADPILLEALDDALRKADASAGNGYSGDQIRSRLNEWISK